eukprot:scaffold20461_cov117-Cylindrotheca_fusiformis.AAC.10
MEELSQAAQADALRMCWQMILNLVASPVSKDAHRLEDRGTVDLGARYGWQGELLVYCDLEAAAKRAIKDGDRSSKLSPGVFHEMRGMYLQATAFFAMAQRTRKRMYRTRADKLANLIKGWDPNVRHCHNGANGGAGSSEQEARPGRSEL